MTISRIAIAACLLAGAAPAAAQSVDLRDIFSNQGFYRKNAILQGRGDVAFTADMWLLPGPADSTRMLVGVSLSNSSLRFKREGDVWRANYTVVAEVDPEDGSTFERSWDKSLDLASFDETLVPGELIVFQAEVPIAPGDYEVKVTVRDRNADQSGRVEKKLEVPAAGALRLTLVPLKLTRGEGDSLEYVVHPSHVFSAAPSRVEFLLAGEGAGEGAVVRAALHREPPAREDDEEEEELGDPLAVWSDTLAGGGEFTAFGAFETGEAFGEYRIVAELLDGAGGATARARTPLLIGGSASWIASHWKDALSLLQYEATEKELEILEDVDDPNQRIEAWTCFWRMRDPIPATVANEALLDYLGRVHTANENWTTALRPGYLSDRGRVYVTLGPPNDIETDPMPRDMQPFEVWTYLRGKEFQIVFVDRIGFNNFQLDTIGTYQREAAAIQRRRMSFLRDRAPQCPLLQPAYAEEDD